MHPHACSTLNSRFHHHRTDRLRPIIQKPAEITHAFIGTFAAESLVGISSRRRSVVRAPIAVRSGIRSGFEDDLFKRLMELWNMTEAHRADRIPVITASQ